MKNFILFFLVGFGIMKAQTATDSTEVNAPLETNSIDSLVVPKELNYTAPLGTFDDFISLSEFLSYVKTFHPIVKQANLIVTESDIKRLKSRGAFDPKLEIDYATKQFKSKEYYDKLNATFKIPVWYGVGVKANYENNDGEYLNPESTTPKDGLYGLGVTASIGGNMLMNQRMADVKQAKNYQKQALEEQKILINNILYDAANTYFDWLRFYNERKIHESFLTNAESRFVAIKKSFYSGEMAAVDTLEANIAIGNRKLNLEKANIKYIKATLDLSNFLWLENNVPVELNSTIIPDTLTIENVDTALNTSKIETEQFDITEHPKLKALGFKTENLEIERKLKFNKLLPTIEGEYNFLSGSLGNDNAFGLDNYKAGIKVSVPIFIRKERSDLKLSKLKIEALNYERSTQQLSIANKVNGLLQELNSFESQIDFSKILVRDYGALSKAEQRKFNLGESSIFYVNIRESKQIEAELKYTQLINNYLKTKAKLYNSLVVF